MISYCIAAYRPTYSKLLVEELLCKTTVPYEVLIWLNVEDSDFEEFLARKQTAGYPVRIVGKTPNNIGMLAYRELFAKATNELVVQIDDDVVCVSRYIAEQAHEIFQKYPKVKQLTADVWQDDYTTGARPPMNAYRPYSQADGLYDGPIDGWFSIYHRSILPLASKNVGAAYFPLGGMVRAQLKRRRLFGLLCTRFKVFHVIGPQYASFFGMLDFEIQKYRKLGRGEIVEWYETEKKKLPEQTDLMDRVARIRRTLSE